MGATRNAKPAETRRAANGFRSFLAYAAEVLRACLRDRAILAALVASQLMLLLPMVAAYPMTEEAICRDRAVEMLGVTQSELASYKESFPAELLDYTEQQHQHYSDAVAAAYPSKEYFAAMAAAKHVEDAEWRAGYLTGDLFYAASAELFDGLARLDDPAVYHSAAELPAIQYLSLTLGVMPAACTLLPSLVAASRVVARLRGRRLLACAPVGRPARWAGAALAGIALTLGCLLATVLPAALVALIKNGAGDPSYPLVSIVDGEVVESTAGLAVAKDMALLALADIAAALLMCLVGRAGTAAALSIGVAAMLVSLLPFYSLNTMPWAGIGAWLPTSYLRLDQVVGHLTYANGVDISAFAGATPARGFAVLACTGLAICVAAGVAGAARNARDALRLRRETA